MLRIIKKNLILSNNIAKSNILYRNISYNLSEYKTHSIFYEILKELNNLQIQLKYQKMNVLK